MDPIAAIKQTNLREMMFAAMVMSASVFPGVLVIWLFNPALIDTASTSKLFLLACSFMVPPILFNSLVMGHFTDKHGKDIDEQRRYGFFAGAVITSLFVFFTVGFAFLFSWSLKTALIVSLSLEVIPILALIRSSVAEVRNATPKPPPAQ
jgi:drug/metabolite transporter (DMT)-like permease